MRISEALSPTRDLEVKFQAATLNVTYRPLSYTLEEIDRLQGESQKTGGDAAARRERLDRVAAMISRLVVAWDLTGEDEVVIDPSDLEILRTKVPMNVFTEILGEVRRDQAAGEAQSPSDAT